MKESSEKFGEKTPLNKFGSANPDILKTIGWTPMVRLNKLTESLRPHIFAKLELLLPRRMFLLILLKVITVSPGELQRRLQILSILISTTIPSILTPITIQPDLKYGAKWVRRLIILWEGSVPAAP